MAIGDHKQCPDFAKGKKLFLRVRKCNVRDTLFPFLLSSSKINWEGKERQDPLHTDSIPAILSSSRLRCSLSSG